jgi:hypothetical protein
MACAWYARVYYVRVAASGKVWRFGAAAICKMNLYVLRRMSGRRISYFGIAELLLVMPTTVVTQ